MTTPRLARLLPLCALLGALLGACGTSPPSVSVTGDAGTADVPSFVPNFSAAWCRGSADIIGREMTCPTDWPSTTTMYPEIGCIDGGALRTIEQCTMVSADDRRRAFFARCDVARIVQPCPQRIVGACVMRTVSAQYVRELMDAAYFYGQCW